MWQFDPHTGGVKIPDAVKERIRRRIVGYAEKEHAGKFARLDVRFRGACCYIDAYRERFVPDTMPPESWGISHEDYVEQLRNTPTHLCRIRYFGSDERWSLAFYTYSNEKYTPCVYPNGEFFGTPEAAFDIGATYLDD